MRYGKTWTKEEDLFLEDKVGKWKLETIAEKLGRTVFAVETRMERLGISSTVLESGKITASELAKSCGVESKTVYNNWIKKKGLPAIRKVTKLKARFWLIDIDKFWKWAEQNKDLIDFTRVKDYVLLPQPDWVEMERKRDYKTIPKRKRAKWTKEEENRVIWMYKNNCSFREIAKALQRSETAIRRKVSRLKKTGDLPKDKISLRWTDKEIEMMIQLEKQGLKDEEIAYELGREVPHIRDKRRRMNRKKIS